MQPDFLLLFLIFLVAILYSSVGHGGASGYLALMAFFAFPVLQMKLFALLLNIFVAGIASVQFFRTGNFRWKLFLTFALASVPASFIGAQILLNAEIYKKILGALLLFSVMRILGFFGKETAFKSEINFTLAFIIGFVIGMLSGMIGIGGGILLSPVILLLGWGSIKETSAVSALFITVNSIAGILGANDWNVLADPTVFSLLLPAIIGGTIGSYIGSRTLNTKVLRFVLAMVLLIASVKLILI